MNAIKHSNITLPLHVLLLRLKWECKQHHVSLYTSYLPVYAFICKFLESSDRILFYLGLGIYQQFQLPRTPYSKFYT